MASMCRFHLVDGLTQSRKSWKCFEVLQELLGENKTSLLIFISQSNNKTSAVQTLQRAKAELRHVNVIHAKDVKNIGGDGNSLMIVDFWHLKNARIMADVASQGRWDRKIVVIDEADYGGFLGVSSRMEFLERVLPNHVVFITATVANLSKCIYKYVLSRGDDVPFHALVSGKPCVRHHYVEPSEEYIGPSWFVDNLGWRPLVMPSSSKGMMGTDMQAQREDAIIREVESINDENKRLCLMVTSTKCEDHHSMATRLLGGKGLFNVVVELNSECDRNYLVTFVSELDGQPKSWNIPFSYYTMYNTST